MLQLPEIGAMARRRSTAVRTPDQIAAGDAAVLAAFRQLEFGLADLVQMTSIAGTLVESLGNESIAVEDTAWTAKQAIQELKKTSDQLMFMVYEIEQKALALDKEWQAASAAGDHTFNEREDPNSDADDADSLDSITADRDQWKHKAEAHEKELKKLRGKRRKG